MLLLEEWDSMLGVKKKAAAENEETDTEKGQSEEENSQGIMSQEEIDALFASTEGGTESEDS